MTDSKLSWIKTVLISLLLSGCTVFKPDYSVVTIRVNNRAVYALDLDECKTAGMNYHPDFSVASSVSKTVSGATSNTSLIPVSPLTPVYGAAGGVLSSVNDGFDIASSQHRNVFLNCLSDETMFDHSAILAKPGGP